MKKRTRRERKIDTAFNFISEFRKLRWEFLRLNDKYQRDYSAYLKKDLSEDKFIATWHIFPHDYKNNNSPISVDLAYEPLMLCNDEAPLSVSPCSLPTKAISFDKSDEHPLTHIPEFIGIKINTSFPKEVILSVIEQLLDEYNMHKRSLFKNTQGTDLKAIRMRLEDYYELIRDYKLYKKCEVYCAKCKTKKSALVMAASKKYGYRVDPVEADYKIFWRRIKKCNLLINKGINSINPSQF